MKCTTIRKVNARSAASTSATKFIPVAPGSTITVEGIEFGERYRDNDMWFVDNEGKYYWSGAFSADLTQIPVTHSSRFSEFGVGSLWNFTKGENVKIGIVDCGIDPAHISLVNSDLVIQNTGDIKCLHGTYMAAIIGSKNPATGYVGIAPQSQVFFSGYGDIENLTPAALDAILHDLADMDIINMSFAIRKNPSKPKSAASQNLLAEISALVNGQNKILIAASGNNGTQTGFLSYPAGYDNIISVSSYDNIFSILHKEANFWKGITLIDSYNPFFDKVASAETDFSTIGLSGTSPATAFVSGIFALLIGSLKKKGESLSAPEMVESISRQVTVTSNDGTRSFETRILDKEKILSHINH